MGYISLYRKYRPQLFEDVSGQEHVTRTLQNAIRAERIGHAYLFCGSRGTGKTTVARLLAKALNCEKGPTPEPCNTCDACVAITEGRAVDVVEMDAASHRSVDDMDALRDGVKYPPMQLRYKVYIIDEAHQLSSHAKDAFLKTLEEPPAHAVFVLATTEAHEIPLTIRSRCQQFDFRRGTHADVSQRLKFVSEVEGIEIEPEAVDTIARNAAGSWRDALSLMEQVTAFTDAKITLRDVNAVIGAVEQETLFQVGDVLAKKDSSAAFELAERLVAEGKDVRELLRAISGHFRDLLFAQADPRKNGEGAGQLHEQAGLFTRQKLISAVEVFSQADKDTKWSDQHRLILEMSLLKAMEEPEVKSVSPAHAPAEHRTQPPPAPRPGPPARPPVSEPKADAPAKPAPRKEAPEEVLGDGEVTIEEVRKCWPAFLKPFKGSKDASIYPILFRAQPTRVEEGNTVVIGFLPDRAFDRNQVEQPLYRKAIIKTLGHLLRKKVNIQTEVLASEEVEPLEDEPVAGVSLLDAVVSTFQGSVVESEEPLIEEEKNPWEDN